MVKTYNNLFPHNGGSLRAESLHKPSGMGDLPKLLKWWLYTDVWPFYGQVKFASLCICMGSITFVWEKCWELQMTSPLKLPVQCCSNLMWSLFVAGDWKIATMVAVYYPRCMATMPLYGKNLQKSSPEPKKPWDLIFAQIIVNWRSTKIDKIMVLHLPLTARSYLLPHAFVWSLYIYMENMFRIHILDITSIIQLNRNLMMSIGASSTHKIAKTERIENPRYQPQQPSWKSIFRHLFPNLWSL